MSNTQSRIQEQIYKEYKIDNETLVKFNLGILPPDEAEIFRELLLSLNAALRGAEIALENQWIRVEDKIPETYRNVQITDGLLICTGYVGVLGKIVSHNSMIVNSKNITHWAELPTPPKP